LKKILLLSDTHSYIDKRILSYAKNSDEVWHAGDIGKLEVLEQLEKVKKTKAVFGNIDDHILRAELNEIEIFNCEMMKVCMIHIAGKPPYYNQKTKDLIKIEKPKILVYGHSHILKVEYDKKNQVLCVNPGAVGKHGFHKKRTMIQLEIDNNKIKNMVVIEMNSQE
jgi:putative phosphoesterase|tara:strand:- start:1391 stop:1888 length:498 start_codon:yes stop_codon:yes gene_type:complete